MDLLGVGMSEHAMEIDDGMIDLIIETYIASGVVGIENMDLWGVLYGIMWSISSVWSLHRCLQLPCARGLLVCRLRGKR